MVCYFCADKKDKGMTQKELAEFIDIIKNERWPAYSHAGRFSLFNIS
jgi:hypothetical protein